MLASAQRLRRRDEFAAALRDGRRVRRGALVVHLAPPDAAAPDEGEVRAQSRGRGVRAGFIVSRSVGGAVARNLVRRRLRHLTRARLTDLPAGTHLVVRALPEASGRPYRELGADLDAALAAARAGGRR